jgi:glycosyltransferase involved in cell wall biosynthesis
MRDAPTVTLLRKGEGMVTPVAVVAWSPFQPRTSALAASLGGNACHIASGLRNKGRAWLPLRYLIDAVRTFRALNDLRPAAVIAVTPPVFVPFVGWVWCLLHRRPLVVDCHTGTFHSRRWSWALPIHRVLLRRAQTVLVHSEEDECLVNRWEARALLLPDDLAELDQPLTRPRHATPRVVVAGRLDADEPVAAVLEAAWLLQDVEVRLTGDAGRLPAGLRSNAPGNAVFTGFLRYPDFLAELNAADIVAVFTSDPHVMSRAAFETIGLGRPLVLSDAPGLRGRFGEAALFCPNQPAAIARALRQALDEQATLADKSRRLGKVLREQRERALTALRLALATVS